MPFTLENNDQLFIIEALEFFVLCQILCKSKTLFKVDFGSLEVNETKCAFVALVHFTLEE